MAHLFSPGPLARRVLRRSGQLTFDVTLDSDQPGTVDPRHAWLADWIGSRLRRARVADVGCWTGQLLAWAREQGAAYAVGIDLEGPWLDVARRRPEIDRLIGLPSLQAMPSELLGSCDLLFFLETLEHLPRGTEADSLATLATMLAPTGQLIMSTPLAGTAALLDPAWLLVGHRHYRLVTLDAMLTASGLSVQEIRYSGNLWTSAATCCFYFRKHLLRLRGRPRRHKWLRVEPATGLQTARRWSSTSVWIRARLTNATSSW